PGRRQRGAPSPCRGGGRQPRQSALAAGRLLVQKRVPRPAQVSASQRNPSRTQTRKVPSARASPPSANRPARNRCSQPPIDSRIGAAAERHPQFQAGRQVLSQPRICQPRLFSPEGRSQQGGGKSQRQLRRWSRLRKASRVRTEISHG